MDEANTAAAEIEELDAALEAAMANSDSRNIVPLVKGAPEYYQAYLMAQSHICLARQQLQGIMNAARQKAAAAPQKVGKRA